MSYQILDNTKINDTIEIIFKKYFSEMFKSFNNVGNNQPLRRYIYRGIPASRSADGSSHSKIQSSAAYRLKHDAYIKNKDKTENKIEYHQIDFITYHKNLIEQSKKNVTEFSSSSLSEIELLAEIQHYGGATCLIDFSFNYLIALYFAAQSYLITSEKEKDALPNSNTPEDQHKIEDNGTLFIVDLYNPINEKIFLLSKKYLNKKVGIEDILMKRELYGNSQKPRMWMWQPYKLNNRILKQDSVFLFSMASVEKGINLEYEERTIDACDKEGILYILSNYFNISAETIFEDLPGYSSLSNGRQIEINDNVLKHGTCLTYGRELYRQEEFTFAENVLNCGINCLDTTNCRQNDAKCKYKTICISDKSQLSELYFFKALSLEKNNNYYAALICFDKSLRLFENLSKENPQMNYFMQRITDIYVEELNIYYLLREFKNGIKFCKNIINEKIYPDNNPRKIKLILAIVELSIITHKECNNECAQCNNECDSKRDYETYMEMANKIIAKENITDAILKFNLFMHIGEFIFKDDSRRYRQLSDPSEERPKDAPIIEWNYIDLYKLFKDPQKICSLDTVSRNEIIRIIKKYELDDRLLYEKCYLSKEDF